MPGQAFHEIVKSDRRQRLELRGEAEFLRHSGLTPALPKVGYVERYEASSLSGSTARIAASP